MSHAREGDSPLSAAEEWSRGWSEVPGNAMVVCSITGDLRAERRVWRGGGARWSGKEQGGAGME